MALWPTPESVADLIVVGGGVSGLIASRNVKRSRPDLTVLLFEAKPRLGGRFYSIPNAFGTNIAVDLGKEWLDPTHHSHTMSELDRYDIRTQSLKRLQCWSFQSKVSAKSPANGSELKKVFMMMDADSDMLNFCGGYEQLDHDYLDISFANYIDRRIRASAEVQEYLFSIAFLLFGADPGELSAMTILQYIRGYRSAELAFSTINESTSIVGGMGSLIHSIADENAQIGVHIHTSTAVALVTEMPVANSISIAGGEEEQTLILLRTTDGRVYATRSLILAIPLACIPSIRFSTPLPNELMSIAEKGNCSRNLKVGMTNSTS